MATKIKFGNKVIQEPGAYSRIVSGIQNAPLDLSYGNVLLIDTGSGAGWGAGSGITGTLKSGVDSVSIFSQLGSFQEAVKGGEHWLWGKYLFKPDGFNSIGVSKLNMIRACTTVAGEVTFAPVGGGANGGTIVLQARDEGIVGNGMSNSKNEVLATGSVEVTAFGATDDEIVTEVDEDGVVVELSNYVVLAGDSTNDLLATSIAADINAGTATHGYSATVLAAVITITARANSGAAINTWILSNTITGTVTTTIVTFSGGVNGDVLRGYGYKMFESKISAGKYFLRFYVGTFKGLDADGDPYDYVKEVDSTPAVVVTTDDFTTIAELNAWMLTNQSFTEYFAIKSYAIAGDGSVDAIDFATYTPATMFSGGTEVYGAGDFTDALSSATELDYTFILSDKWGDEAQNVNNDTLLTFLIDESKYGEFLIVGGGKDATKFTGALGSIETANHFDSENVIVVHAGFKKVKPTGGGYKVYDSIVKTSAVLGRICGLSPQVPATFKGIDMDADNHEMSVNERILALDNGVLHTKFDLEFGKYLINQAINTKLDNQNMVNPDGSSYEVSIMRIAAQLNKELVYNAKRLLLAQPQGVNRNTLSKGDVKNFVEGYLNTKTATDTTDNLIITFRNVTVTVQGDAYYAAYEFEPNFPVNKLFFTGIMMDFSVSN